jgi:C4-dicarboxylate-specific signal transduction histidine kinase
VSGPSPEALWGRIAAGLSHEMNNVLATIRESSGLMQDLLRVAAPEAVPHRDKFDRALMSVQKAVGRGVDLTRHLSRWAHTTDSQRSEIDPDETANLAVFLLNRQARMRRVELSAAEGRRLPRLKADPAGLVMALAGLIEHALAAAPEGSALTLRPVKDGRRLAFEITLRGAGGAGGAAPGSEPQMPGADLVTWLAGLGAEVSAMSEGVDRGWRLLLTGP